MADPIKPAPALPANEAAELAAFRENAAYEKRIAEIIAERRAICSGAIPDAMLRDIAITQIASDKANAAK
jgi:hypothetical protein